MKFWTVIILIVLALLVGFGLFVGQRAIGLNIFSEFSSSSSSSLSSISTIGGALR